jgi:hypothetical protein
VAIAFSFFVRQPFPDHLACGDNYPSLSYNFRVAPNTISLIINEVYDAIKAEFAAEVIQCPTTTEESMRTMEKKPL